MRTQVLFVWSSGSVEILDVSHGSFRKQWAAKNSVLKKKRERKKGKKRRDEKRAKQSVSKRTQGQLSHKNLGGSCAEI